MITKLTKHDQHEVYVQLEHYTQINHYASLRCRDCQTHIQWLHKWDVEEIKKLGVKIEPSAKSYYKLISLRDLGL